MPVILSLKFDGGGEEYVRGIDKTLKQLSNWSSLWDRIIELFEGNGDLRSPIIQIFESEGAAIGGTWGATSTAYNIWKGRNWQDAREVDVPINGNSAQILSGNQLRALLDSGHQDAVREIQPLSMAYGVNNDYSDKNQDRFKILDVYPEMEKSIDRTLTRWLQTGAPELEITE
jgi:hypothetical protein